MTLQIIATELIEFVALHLESDADLNAFCRTSQLFYHLFNEHLYQRDARGPCKALLWGASTGITSTVNKSLEHDADINIATPEGETPLILAVKNQHMDMVRLLLARGPSLHHRNMDGNSIVYLAASVGNSDLVRTLLALGADPNGRGFGHDTPMLVAVRKGYFEVVKAIFEAGPYMDEAGEWGETPLQVVVSCAQHDILSFFLDNGISRDDSAWFRGLRALEIAILNHDIATLKLLLEGGANSVALWTDGRNAIMNAAASGQDDMAILMTEKLVDPAEMKDEHGKGLLWYAARGRCEKYTEFLLDKGLDPCTTGWIPLTGAILGGAIKIVELLLGRGATMDYKDGIGRTPLRIAFEAGKRDIVKFLVEKGAPLKEAKLDDVQMKLMQRFLASPSE
ncbi:hypothetical protein ACHAPJ_008589 [Fusarium lateritium]